MHLMVSILSQIDPANLQHLRDLNEASVMELGFDGLLGRGCVTSYTPRHKQHRSVPHSRPEQLMTGYPAKLETQAELTGCEISCC